MNDEREIQEFTHTAMETEFKLSIAATDAKYARQAAVNAFRELDNVETLLSRYIEYSDISRINNLAAGEETIIDPATFDCLQAAIAVMHDTEGAFDVTFASTPTTPRKQLFKLERGKYTCRVLDSGLLLDLGGIGKGFALDQIAELLVDWDIEQVLIQSSQSTVLARQAPSGKSGWQVGFGGPTDRCELKLSNQALSGSGIAVQGEHIVDRSGRNDRQNYRAWALSKTGARADALSTAFMLMDNDQIEQYIARHPSERAWIQKDGNDAIVEI